jgi:phage baseplate assembly protein W
MSNLALVSSQRTATWATASSVDYGHDLFCITDLDAGMLEVDGRRCLAQAIARRLITPRGGLIDDPNYGYDLTVFLNGDFDQATLARMNGQIVAECLKDERVVSAYAQVVVSGNVLIVTLSLTDGLGPFPLVLSVSNVSVSILNIGQL